MTRFKRSVAIVHLLVHVFHSQFSFVFWTLIPLHERSWFKSKFLFAPLLFISLLLGKIKWHRASKNLRSTTPGITVFWLWSLGNFYLSSQRLSSPTFKEAKFLPTSHRCYKYQKYMWKYFIISKVLLLLYLGCHH